MRIMRVSSWRASELASHSISHLLPALFLHDNYDGRIKGNIFTQKVVLLPVTGKQKKIDPNFYITRSPPRALSRQSGIFETYFTQPLLK